MAEDRHDHHDHEHHVVQDVLHGAADIFADALTTFTPHDQHEHWEDVVRRYEREHPEVVTPDQSPPGR